MVSQVSILEDEDKESKIKIALLESKIERLEAKLLTTQEALQVSQLNEADWQLKFTVTDKMLNGLRDEHDKLGNRCHKLEKKL